MARGRKPAAAPSLVLERAPHRSDGRNRKPRGRSTFSCGALAIGGIGTLAARMLWRTGAPAVLPPPPEFWAADLLLNCSGAARQQLVDNARWAATLKQRAVELGLAPSTKSWLPLGATPEYGMEQLVALLVNRTLSERRGCGGALDRAAGVEWWLRIHGGREGLGFHHDSNWLDVRAGLNRSLAFPLCSSVFYLTDEGGPLVALRPRDTALRPTVVPAAAAAAGEYPALYRTLLSRIHAAQAAGKSDSLVSYPKFGKHVRFDGRVYHGGLGELAPPTSSDADLRISVVVAFWDHDLGVVRRHSRQQLEEPLRMYLDPKTRRPNPAAVAACTAPLPDEVASSCWPDGFAAHATPLGVRRVDRRRGDERRLAATDVVLAHGAAGGDAGHFEVRLPATGTEDDGSGDAVLVDAEP